MDTFLKIIPLIFSVLSIVMSVYNLMKADKKQNYLELDKAYANLLLTALNKPELRDKKIIEEKYKANDKEFIARYEIYAYLIWNLLETFHDFNVPKIGTKQYKAKFGKNNTWLPVIREENKIHYNWFVRNQRLFKPSFQEYIAGLNNINIRQGTIDEFYFIYDMMKKQFPVSELKKPAQIEKLLRGGRYKFFVIENSVHSYIDKFIGYSFVYVVEEYKSLWIDYLAINEVYQRSGFGTTLFNNIVDQVGQSQYNCFAEIEIPKNQDENSNDNLRIKFYKNQGMEKINMHYTLPTESGGEQMYLYCKSAMNNASLLNKELIGNVINAVLAEVHSDLQCTDDIIKKNLTAVKDIEA